MERRRREGIQNIAAVFATFSGTALLFLIFTTPPPGRYYPGWLYGLAITAIVVGLAVMVWTLFPTDQEKIDQRLKQDARALAERIDNWLEEQLAAAPTADIPKEELTSDQRDQRDRYRESLGFKYGEVFRDELAAFNSELAREQVPQRFKAHIYLSGARKLVRELRAFSEIRGPLSRG